MTGTRPPHLAELNVARLRAPLGSPDMKGLEQALDDVFWLGDRSAGFVWRLKDENCPLVYGRLEGDEVAVTLSVWENFESLQRFVYRTAHGLFMQRRAKWFVPIGGFTTVLWWIDQGAEPGLDDGMARLEHLRAHGPRSHAFSLGLQFDPEGKRVGRSEPVLPRNPNG